MGASGWKPAPTFGGQNRKNTALHARLSVGYRGRAGAIFKKRCPRGETQPSFWAMPCAARQWSFCFRFPGHWDARARRLAAALTRLGLKPGDRVASMMWNHSGHLEVFFGVPCAGGILHTLNIRLHPQEISAIAKHAGDRFLIVDDVLLPVYEKIRHDVPFEKVIVVPYGCRDVPGEFLNYEELLGEAGEDFS